MRVRDSSIRDWIVIFLGAWLFWWFWINTIGRLPHALVFPMPLLFDGIVALSAWFFLRRQKSTGPEQTVSRTELLHAAVVCLPAWVAIGSALFYCLLLYPVDWDGLTYHLPPVVEAYQKGSWGNFDPPFFAIRNFPKLVESLWLWQVLHFGAHGLLLPGLLPLFIGAWVMARGCRQFILPAHWGVILWCTIPLIVKQASTLYIDSFVALLGVCAALGLILSDDLLFGISLPLFVGAKQSAWTPAMILTGSWLVRRAVMDRGLSRRSLARFAIVGGLCVLSCLATLVPNTLETGNPLYPFRITVLGHAFPGIADPSTPSDYPLYPLKLAESTWYERLSFTYLHTTPIAFWDMLQGGLGIPLIVLAMGGFLVSLKKRRWSLPGKEFAAGLPISRSLWMDRYQLWLSGGLILWAAELIRILPRVLQYCIWLIFLFQALWLWADRVWIMGQRPEVEAALRQKDFLHLSSLLSERWSELWEFGEPQKAATPEDRFRIQNRRIRHDSFVCDRGPEMLGVLYGTDLENRITWVKPDLSKPSGKCVDGLWIEESSRHRP